MSNEETHDRLDLAQAEIVAAYLEDREDELLDAMVTAGALVACADGRAVPVERCQLLDFLNRNGLLSTFTRADVLDVFEQRVHQFSEPCGGHVVADRLLRIAGRSPARLVVSAAEHVAVADGRLHPGERHALQLVRFTLGALPRPAAPSVSCPSQP